MCRTSYQLVEMADIGGGVYVTNLFSAIRVALIACAPDIDLAQIVVGRKQREKG